MGRCPDLLSDAEVALLGGADGGDEGEDEDADEDAGEELEGQPVDPQRQPEQEAVLQHNTTDLTDLCVFDCMCLVLCLLCVHCGL